MKRLNRLYGDVLTVKLTLQKSLKYLAQTESYRMLKDWSYEVSEDVIPDDDNAGAAEQPDFTDV